MSETRAPYNAGFDIQELLQSLPPGLDRVLAKIFSFHVGRENSLSRGALMLALDQMGFRFKDDRPVRAAISALRKTEKPEFMICSTGGVNGGYWLAASRQEVEEFIANELDPRISDLAATKRGMTRAAMSKWGEGVQGRLF
jgi:hypothetical protein